MPTLREHWEDMPLWGKALVIGGGSYIVYKWLSDDSGSSDYLTGPNDRTYQQYEYDVAADELYEYFNAGAFGMTEDDSAIGEILMSMQTNGDVIALNNAFGTRYTWNLGVISGSGGNLTYWISTFLDNDVKQEAKANYSDKGINWPWH